MEPAPIEINTPSEGNLYYSKIDFIEELLIQTEKGIYKIQFGIREDDLVIKAIPEQKKNLVFYQQSYTIVELKNISVIFSMYNNAKDIIGFLMKLKFEFEEKNDDMLLKFNVFLPDGQNKLIRLNLKRCLMDTNSTMDYLMEEIKSIKIEMQMEKKKNEAEIKMLKNEIEIYKKEIINLKEQNRQIIETVNKINNYYMKPNPNYQNAMTQNSINQNIMNQNVIDTKNILIDSKIIKSIGEINFILYHLKSRDKLFDFKEIKLLYRGSRDGDRTKTCHSLCDNKPNILIIMRSDTNLIFGGYSKIGFKINKRGEYKKDNNSFLFSVNLNKIYPCIQGREVICNIGENYGLCFSDSLSFSDNFMHEKKNNIKSYIKTKFCNMQTEYEMNGGKNNFIYSELEVFQLL